LGPEQILYYEDFPYAGRSGVLQTWLETEGAEKSWHAEQITLTEKQIAKRMASVACYTSQLRALPSETERWLEISARAAFSSSFEFTR